MNKHQPKKILLQADKNYAWCACGQSKRSAFCDGSHSNTGIRSQIFSVSETKEYLLCTCQLTDNQPFCKNQKQCN